MWFRLSDPLYQRLDKQAKKEKKKNKRANKGMIVRKAIVQYLNKEEKDESV